MEGRVGGGGGGGSLLSEAGGNSDRPSPANDGSECAEVSAIGVDE